MSEEKQPIKSTLYRCEIPYFHGSTKTQFAGVSAYEACRRAAIDFVSAWVNDAEMPAVLNVSVSDFTDDANPIDRGVVQVRVSLTAEILNPRGDTDKVDEYAGVLGPSELQRLIETIEALNEMEDDVWADLQRRAADVAGVMQPIIGDNGTSMDATPPSLLDACKAISNWNRDPLEPGLPSYLADFLNNAIYNHSAESIVADRAPITRPASAESIVGGEKQ